MLGGEERCLNYNILYLLYVLGYIKGHKEASASERFNIRCVTKEAGLKQIRDASDVKSQIDRNSKIKH